MSKTTKPPAKCINPAEPEVTMGQRPDGSPWVMHVDFGHGIIVSDIWGMRDRNKDSGISPGEARARAAALLAAAEWIETGQAQKLETQPEPVHGNTQD